MVLELFCCFSPRGICLQRLEVSPGVWGSALAAQARVTLRVVEEEAAGS